MRKIGCSGSERPFWVASICHLMWNPLLLLRAGSLARNYHMTCCQRRLFQRLKTSCDVIIPGVFRACFGRTRLQTRAPGRGVENRKIPEGGWEGVQRSLEGAKSLLHRCNARLHRCKTRLDMVQETLGRPLRRGSKRPCAPSPNHFRGFPIFDPSPKHSGLQDS